VLRLIILILLLAVSVPAARIKLYLTDGNYHLVREYEVLADRVRFYSIERSQWEEIPLDLVDLERTRREAAEEEQRRKQETQEWQREEAAERAMRAEAASVPDEKGVYLVTEERMLRLPRAELKALTDKKKEILKVITPVPMIAGKRTVVVEGPYAEVRVQSATPEFYIRLHQLERFGIIRLTPKPGKGYRIVETWHVAPVTNVIFEEHKDVPVFKWQVDNYLYKLWPKEPLEPGEYAVAEFSPGEANIMVWDFGWWPEGTPAVSAGGKKKHKKRGK